MRQNTTARTPRAGLIISCQIVFLMLMISSALYAQSKPEKTLIFHHLFQNLSVKLQPEFMDFGQSCNDATVACLLEGVLLGISNGDNTSYAWSDANCNLQNKNDYIKFVRGNPIFSPHLSHSLRRIKTEKIWTCAVRWGVTRGELRWHQELRFSLTWDKKKVIRHSFGTVNTP